MTTSASPVARRCGSRSTAAPIPTLASMAWATSPSGQMATRPYTPSRSCSPAPEPGRSTTSTTHAVAFEADLPRIETNTCNRSTGAGCTLIPTTDKGTPAAFYPFFSAFQHKAPPHAAQSFEREHGCLWAFGNDIPGVSTDFGRNAQYGSLLSTTYLAFGGGGATTNQINNFRQIIPNPCRAR